MRRLYFGLFSIIGFLLIALYQNIGRLSHNEKPKSLLMPHYFASIYENQKNINKHKTVDDYENMLHDSPLYKRLLQEITIHGGSKGCDPSDPFVICPQSEKVRNDAKNESLVSLSFDPLKTAAFIRMHDWKGQVRYSTPTNGTKLELSRPVSNSSSLNLEYDQGSSQSKVSYELTW